MGIRSLKKWWICMKTNFFIKILILLPVSVNDFSFWLRHNLQIWARRLMQLLNHRLDNLPFVSVTYLCNSVADLWQERQWPCCDSIVMFKFILSLIPGNINVGAQGLFINVPLSIWTTKKTLETDLKIFENYFFHPPVIIWKPIILSVSLPFHPHNQIRWLDDMVQWWLCHLILLLTLELHSLPSWQDGISGPQQGH